MIPSSGKINACHQGICKCRETARESVWRQELSKQIEEMITIHPTERSRTAKIL